MIIYVDLFVLYKVDGSFRKYNIQILTQLFLEYVINKMSLYRNIKQLQSNLWTTISSSEFESHTNGWIYHATISSQLHMYTIICMLS